MSGKQSVRKAINALKAQQTAAGLSRQSILLMDRLERHPAFIKAGVVLLYHPLPDEPDTRLLLQKWQYRKTILLPVVVGDSLELRKYRGEIALHTGAFGISEPDAGPESQALSIDLAVVPGVAFDALGHRLGRGKGYYDRLFALPEMAAVYKIGCCFDFQKCPSVPFEPHDVPMNEVL